LSGTSFSELKNVGINYPERPENITTLKWSTRLLFTATTHHLTPVVVKYKTVEQIWDIL
jgi:hypothetical protein